MIHEYALEPELVASWRDRVLGRFFIEHFGFGTGRIVSRYPKKWRKLVWDAFQAAFGAAAGEIERKRVEELLARLTTPEIRRPAERRYLSRRFEDYTGPTYAFDLEGEVKITGQLRP